MTSQAHLPTSDASMLRLATVEDIPAIMALERIPEFHAMVGRWPAEEHLRALMAHVFQQLRAHRLWLDVFATNARALHVYRNTGFREDGVFREAIYREGEFHTLLLFSILDREYAQAAAAE